MQKSFALWHGGMRWDSAPEVQAPRGGRYECGPGIYLSTDYEDAYRYARGGKVTTLVTLTSELSLLENTLLPLDTVVDFVKGLARLKHRKEILTDLRANVARKVDAHVGPAEVNAQVLVNLCVNYEAVAGKPGVALARWLAEQGIDAAWHSPHGRKHWLVVFNPKVIKSYKVIRAADVTLDMRHLPKN